MRQLISYYYISTANLERLERFQAVSGDSERTLVMQYVRGWLGRNRERYLALAIQDAEARGLRFSEWGQIVLSKGIRKLPGSGLTEPPVEPLRLVMVGVPREKRTLNYINLGRQNVALLRIAQHYSGLKMVWFLSAIVQEHLDRNWEKLYQSQVEAEDLASWDELARVFKERKKHDDISQ